jgi:hypothetical protein
MVWIQPDNPRAVVHGRRLGSIPEPEVAFPCGRSIAVRAAMKGGFAFARLPSRAPTVAYSERWRLGRFVCSCVLASGVLFMFYFLFVRFSFFFSKLF